jgi:hypothetical protein
MKNKITLIILILTILMAAPTITSAQLVSPGVSKGDIFEYNYNATWNSTDPNAQVTANVAKLIQTQSFQIRIINVTGTTVNAEVTTRYRDGTTKTETGFVDVQSGSIHMPFGTMIIAGNLNANDKIYPTWDQDTINQTVTRTYQSGNRETNQLLVETTSENSYEKTEVYYDKIKGIAVESYYESRDTYNSQTETFTETITNTNADVWTVASAPTPTATGISPTPTPTGISPTPTPTPTATGISPTPTTAHAPTATPIAFVFSAVDWLIVVIVIIIVLILIILAWYRRRRKPKTQQTQTTYLGTF